MQCDDIYAKGMSSAGDEQDDLTPALDESQFRMIEPYLRGTTLEIGAGGGRISRKVIERGKIGRFVVSEPSSEFFKRLRRRVPAESGAELECDISSGLARKYPGTFDTIYSVHVLEHVEDDSAFLQDCYDMLKPGGQVVILVPALQGLYSDLDRKIGHFRRYDKKMVRALLRGSNFKLETLYYTNFFAIIPSFLILKLGRLNYQDSDQSRGRFMLLYKIYSRFFVPLMDAIERVVPAPVGLNLTFVLKKPN